MTRNGPSGRQWTRLELVRPPPIVHVPEFLRQAAEARAAALRVKPRLSWRRKLLIGLWMVFMLLFPLVRFLLALALACQFVASLFLWHEPGYHAGLRLLLPFVLLSTAYYVATTPPKGYES